MLGPWATASSRRGDDWADLKAMVKDAVLCHFGDEHETKVARLHFVTDEAMAI